MPDRSAVIDQLRAAGVECFTRAEWGSPQQKAGAYATRASTHPMPTGPADFHFLHITVTRDSDTVAEGAAGARQIETYGYSSPPMVSYQDLVTNEGRYFQGQDYGTKGTHTVNDKRVPGFPNDLNLLGYACALMQNVDDEVTDIQVQVVAMVFAARELAGWVRRGAPIYPHRKFAAKACPGDRAVARLREIEQLKNDYVKHGLPEEENDMETKAAIQALEARVDAQNVLLSEHGKLLREIRNAQKNQGDKIRKVLKAEGVEAPKIDRILAAVEAD
ncbi:hypothetical protein [Nocardioides sp. R-C-SC26]|uniref:hypothetical protein n=1 Tax=Nocardioides sp. R-C-SC26 TaxID=2870414 RepID=UPI001E3719F5|nr:hypothetical protein [Nocardioides sp. R-C-SC26]